LSPARTATRWFKKWRQACTHTISAPPAAAQFVGIPTGSPTSLAATVKARQHMFGFENVNPVNGDVRRDRVVFAWLTTTTFAATAT
jgi:hypothetical protein